MARHKADPILVEGLTPEEILALPQDELDALISADSVVFRAGSATILGQFKKSADRLLVELAQIDGGGEGVLPTLWLLAERHARQRGLRAVEWHVHAIHCAQPNLKLRRVLEKRGFTIKTVPGVGQVYQYLHEVPPASDGESKE